MKRSSRDYQVDVVGRVRGSIAKGNRRVVMVMPTGAGKTHTAAVIMEGAVQKGKRVLFLANRRKLVQQCAGKLESEGIPFGIFMAGHQMSSTAPVQVASIQTLSARCMREEDPEQPMKRMFQLSLPPADLIIADECHVSLSNEYQKLYDQYPNAILIGLTATPCRENGKGLGPLYTDMILGPSIANLRAEGWLVPVRYFGPSAPDLEGVKVSTTTGDYDEEQLAERMDQAPLIGDIIENWQRICPDRQTVIFAASVAHAMHIADEFNKVGVTAAHISAETKDADRKEIYDAVRAGRIRVLANYGVLVEGWDEPQVSCAVLAQPTKNPGRYLQMAGRVLRPVVEADGVTWKRGPDGVFLKPDAILIDHSGNIERHGFVEDEFMWSLDPKESIQDRHVKARRNPPPGTKPEPKPITCSQCFTVFRNRKDCPSCGSQAFRKKPEAVEYLEAELIELRMEESRRKKQDAGYQREFFEGLLGQAAYKGYKPGWVAYVYKEKFGHWPKFERPIARPPGADVMAFLKHMAIKRAKSSKGQGKERRAHV